jgi:elongation factor G
MQLQSTKSKHFKIMCWSTNLPELAAPKTAKKPIKVYKVCKKRPNSDKIFSYYMRKPIVRMSRIAERMAEQDFGWYCPDERDDEIGVLAKSLNTLSRMDPSFRVQHDLDGGFWYLHTVGEVQLDVLLSRLKREFGCEVKAGSPEVRWQERLCREVGPVENSFQLGPHKISIKLSATPLEGDAHDIRLSAEFLETAPREILAGVRSALLESTDVGILGKGPLVGVCFEVREFTWTEGALPPMIKKACADAVTKLIKPVDMQLHEPIMELSLECPVNFAGLVTGDIQARDGKVKEIGGDGRTHFLKAEIPLRKIFGYATGVRSISKGTALYSMKLLGYRPIPASFRP